MILCITIDKNHGLVILFKQDATSYSYCRKQLYRRVDKKGNSFTIIEVVWWSQQRIANEF